MEDARGGGSMHVVAFDKGTAQVLVAAQVSHDAQLYLRIVGREEETPVVRNERLAYLSAVLTAHWDVLQVWIARREAPGCRNGLVERSVYMPRLGVYQFRQSVDISAH